MSEAILLLRLEHHHADDLLVLIEQQLDQDSPIDLELMETIFEYFADYPDQCHHPVEDLIYRKLHARNPDRAASVGELLEDHKNIGQLTQRVAKTLNAALDNDDVRMTKLRDVLRKFVDHYRAHMTAEEKDFFPLALDVLSTSDWSEVEFDIFDRSDPLFDQKVEGRYRQLRREVDALARRSYRRACFVRESKQLHELTSIQAFNDKMEEAALDYRLVEHSEGGYGLEFRGEVVVDIPKCSPARAVWCAYFYVEARTRH